MKRRSEVHIWRAQVAQPPWLLDRFWNSLAAEEQTRANRFRFDKDRNQYIASHGILRDVLSRYLTIPAAQIRFAYGERGKPRLAEYQLVHDGPLHFNMSHSANLALYAVAQGGVVGIDLEFIRPLDDFLRIAETFFSPAECAALHNLPETAQLGAFYSCWTRKEAYLKARGDGLSINLDQFAVSLGPEEAPALLCVQDAPNEPARWTLNNISLGPECAAALVTEGRPAAVAMCEWTPADASGS